MFDFKDKVVIITGPARLRPRAGLAKHGAELALRDINDRGGEETLTEVKR